MGNEKWKSIETFDPISKMEPHAALELKRKLGIEPPNRKKGFFVACGHGHQMAWANILNAKGYILENPQMMKPNKPDDMTRLGHFIGANLPVTETAIAIAAIIIITRHLLRKRKRKR